MHFEYPKDPTPALERHYIDRRIEDGKEADWPPKNWNFLIVDRDENTWPSQMLEQGRLLLLKTFAPLTTHLSKMRDRMIERFPLKISSALKANLIETLPPAK